MSIIVVPAIHVHRRFHGISFGEGLEVNPINGLVVMSKIFSLLCIPYSYILTIIRYWDSTEY